MMIESVVKKDLIAPCGMNCRICVDYFGYTMTGKKRKMKCIGCNPSGKSCAHLKKHCKNKTIDTVEFCFKCSDFPCKQLKKLDSKYRKRYLMSMIENLESIRDNGMDAFLKQQKDRYTCSNCGAFWCVHTKICYMCEKSK